MYLFLLFNENLENPFDTLWKTILMINCKRQTATLYSLNASFSDVLRSVDSFRSPIIKAQGT